MQSCNINKKKIIENLKEKKKKKKPYKISKKKFISTQYNVNVMLSRPVAVHSIFNYSH